MSELLIVGVGGTTREGSTSERMLRQALSHAEQFGATTRHFTGHDLLLPAYSPGPAGTKSAAAGMIDALRKADGIIISSPGYHGSFSGLIKNALDYTEEMRCDGRIYFEGRAVGLIVCAAGAQAIGSTLAGLRSIVHALRGWPTPLGVGVNTVAGPEPGDAEAASATPLRQMVHEVVWFARAHAASVAQPEHSRAARTDA